MRRSTQIILTLKNTYYLCNLGQRDSFEAIFCQIIISILEEIKYLGTLFMSDGALEQEIDRYIWVSLGAWSRDAPPQ